MSLKEQTGLGPELKRFLLETQLEPSPGRPEKSQSVSRGMVGGAAGREGSANKSPLPSRAHQSFQNAYASVISLTSLKDLVLYALC